MRSDELSPGFGSAGSHVASIALLAAPACILSYAAYTSETQSWILWTGAAALFFGGALFARFRKVWRPPVSACVILLYVMAVVWLWFPTRDLENKGSFVYLARGYFVIIAIGLLMMHDLFRTGLEPRRRAGSLNRRIRHKSRWPVRIEDYRHLPEVAALREASQLDPGPVIEMFDDIRPEVRIAAFMALENRKFWRPGESNAVVTAIQRMGEPIVRAAGLRALGSATDPESVHLISQSLRDSSPEVRRAAMDSVLAGGNDRWTILRDMVREALSDQQQATDGPVQGAHGRLPAVAVCDLNAWAGETEPLSSRSVRSLIDHFAAALNTNQQPELPAELAAQILDHQTSPILRMELAGLMRSMQLMTPELLDRMTNVDQPGPIRLLAAEQLLALDPNHPDAIDVLRGLGRQPNRESALTIARLLQNYLGMKMGLPDGPIAPNSKIATEAAKRVLQWASGKTGTLGGPQGSDRMQATPGPVFGNGHGQTTQINSPNRGFEGYGSSQNLRR